ncbi:MAG: phage exclusion protein Lit family protein [Acidobacteriota bacterium]
MDEKSLTQAIGGLIFEAAPERRTEIADLWQNYAPQFSRMSDKDGFAIEAGPWGLILFTPRTMGQIWILGFAAWRALEAYCPYVLLCSEIAPSLMADVPDQAEADAALGEELRKVEELRNIDCVDAFDWPSGIPEPSASLPKAARERAIVDSIKIASAYVFLHEIRHVMFASSAERPVNIKAEELECDGFARGFLLDRIPDYCTATGEAQDAVLNKRLVGLALGGFILLQVTKDRDGSESHPAVAERLRGLTQNEGGDGKSYPWVYACCLLLSVLRREEKLPPRLAFSDPRDLFEKMVLLLQQDCLAAK